MGWLGQCVPDLLSFVRFGKKIAEAVEAALPGGFSVLNPLFHGGKSFRFNAAGAYAACFFGVHQAAFFENLQVLDDSRERNGQRLGQLRDGDGRFAEALDDGAARGVAERVEDAVDAGRVLVLSFGVGVGRWHYSASASANLLSRLVQPCLRHSGPSAFSKKADCSVKRRSVPMSLGISSKVASDAENG